ncbi:MAG TPA: tetratricopeptide repeat protein [Lacunisphaera sp.]|nr:tetratricopeptide repeat protein [Lacunisphaera sp.]
MKTLARQVPLLFAFALAGFAQDATREIDDTLMRQQLSDQSERTSSKKQKGPELDPKRIINESNNFLKEREPEMTAEEYAIYERVLTMLGTKPEFALKLLEAMMTEKEKPSPAFEFILGNAYYATGANDKAETSYKSAVERYPTFLRAWNNLGILYYATQRYPDAIRCFSKCVTLGDREPQTFGLLGYSLEQEKRVVQAEMAYMQALTGDPANLDWLEGLLRIYVEGRQFGRAEWLVKDLVKQQPKEPRFWFAYANILLSQNRKLEAIALLEVPASLGVAGATETLLLADLYADQKLVPEAIAAYQRVMATTPKLGEQKLLTLARLMIYSGNLPQARKVLDGLAGKVTPEGRSGFMLARADLLLAENKWPEARGALEDLLKVEPLNGKALISLGKVYVAEDNLARAQFAFEAAYQVPDSLYRACIELATLELRNKHYAKTVEYLEKALTLERTSAVEDFLARVRPLVETDTKG